LFHFALEQKGNFAAFGDNEPITEMVMNVLTRAGVERDLTVGRGTDIGLTGLRRVNSTIPCSQAYDLGGLWTKSDFGGSL